jgi:hypothetical protein
MAELWTQIELRYARRQERLDTDLTGPPFAFMRERWAKKQVKKSSGPKIGDEEPRWKRH